MSTDDTSPTDQPQPPAAASAAEQPAKPTAVRGTIDHVLQMLVDLVNGGDEKMSFSMSITLHVGGTIVTGQLSNGAAFIEHTRDAFIDGWVRGLKAIGAKDGDPSLAGITETSHKYFARLLANYGKRAKGEPHPPATFIHVKDARIITPGASGTCGGVGFWWRGKLESVDAWTMGEIS